MMSCGIVDNGKDSKNKIGKWSDYHPIFAVGNFDLITDKKTLFPSDSTRASMNSRYV